MAELISSYGKYLAVLLGLLAGFPLVWRQRGGLGLKRPWQAVLACVAFSALSVAGAMLFAVLESIISGTKPSLGAISTYGIYFLCPFPLILLARGLRKNLRSGFDAYAFYALPSLFLLRCNCLMSGCCGGREILGSGGLHWPTRQAELLFYAAFLAALLLRERRGAPEGTAFPLLMASYGAFRFVEEWFRETGGTSLIHLAHFWSALAVVIGLGLYFELNDGRIKTKFSRRERSASKC